MTLRQLQIFYAVARHVNITTAASELRVSQPTVSKELKLLEKEFGAKFHLKIGHRIQLTEQGRLLRKAVGTMLLNIEELQRRFKDQYQTKDDSGRLKVGTSKGFCTRELLKILKAFRKMHPHVRPIVRIADSRTMEQMVLNSEVEIALITDPTGSPQISTELCGIDRAVAVVAATHALAATRKLNQETLSKAPVITKTGSRVVAELERKGIKLNAVMQCESPDAVKEAVECGLGIGLLYRSSVEVDLRRGYLKAIEIPRLQEIYVRMFTIYRKGTPLSSKAQDLLSLLRRRLANKLENVHGDWLPYVAIHGPGLSS